MLGLIVVILCVLAMGVVAYLVLFARMNCNHRRKKLVWDTLGKEYYYYCPDCNTEVEV